jgi:phosphotransferase system enzyme I (PtsI)
MAGDPMAAVVLLGLGLDSFSMSALSIPAIKKIIRSVTLSEAKELADQVMAMKSAEAISEFVATWMEERFDTSLG